MLTYLKNLSIEADGRYATSEELDFFKIYFDSFNLRLSAYQKIHKFESEIIQKIQSIIQSNHSKVFMRGSTNVTQKWRLDTVRVLRYSAMALLINDPDYLKERLLIWFSTILQALQVQDLTQLTYQAMAEVIVNYLTPEEQALFLPLIELNLKILCRKPSS